MLRQLWSRHQYLVYVDRKSGFPMIQEWNHDPASAEIIFTISEWFSTPSMPTNLHSYVGSQYVSREFQDFLTKWFVTWKPSSFITLFRPVKWIGGIQCDLWNIYCWNSMFRVRSRRNSRLHCLSFITHRWPTDEARTLPCMVISCNHVWLHTIWRSNHPGSRIWSAPMLRK